MLSDEMNRVLTGVLAVIVVILLTLLGGFDGMIIGDRIEPMNSSFTGVGSPGGVVVGGVVGLIIGFALGLWIAIRLVDASKRRREASLTAKR
jgi:uncharacterized protein YneF (UPF0154 family)